MDNNTTGAPTTNSTTYSQYCSFRLPCGICTRTNTTCPIAIQKTPYSPWWGIYPPYNTEPVPTITTQTGTTISTKDYTANGETTAKCDMSQYERGERKKGD